MRVLITGVSGPIGRDLARLLLAAGHEVAGLAAEPHRYLHPRVDLTVADLTDVPTWQRALQGCDTVIHLDGPLTPSVAEALADHGSRVVTGPGVDVPEALAAGDTPVLQVHTAPIVGRRVDGAALATLAGIVRSDAGVTWQVLHHDDLTRYLAGAATGDATGAVTLVAPGVVDNKTVRDAFEAAGVSVRLPGVRPARSGPALDSTAAVADYGWTAAEAMADLARGLGGRKVVGGRLVEESGRFVLPTEPIPNNLPASDGGHLEPAGPPEYQGEFDTLIDPRLSVQTATNVAEALPRPMTPMTLDIQLGAIRVSNESMGRMLVLEGAALDQHTSLMVGALGHSVYMNASVGVNIVANMPGWDEENVRKDVYGQIPDEVDFRPQGGPPMPQGLASRKATFTATMNVIARARKYKEEAERLHDAAQREALRADEIAALHDAQLQARALLWRDRLAQSWDLASIGVTLTGAASAMHYRGKNPEPVNIDVEQLESARTMLAVERIAAVLRGDDRLIELARNGRVEELRVASPEAARVLDEQLAVMGHRGPGECELANPAFADRPGLLLGSAAGAAQGPAPRREAVTPPRTRTGRMTAGATLARERARDGVVRYTHCLRLATRDLGRRLVDRGLLDQADDAFYLTLDEAFTTPADLRERVARRRAERERFQAIRMPDVVLGAWEPEPAGDLLEVGDSISGLGVFPGQVEGRVRVLLGPDDDIEPGDILVASVTDVGHTAMFGYAAAVVTDIGGAVSHAAIVAREFAIPCVVDTKHATSSLRDGQLVRVDGAAGTITLMVDADQPTVVEDQGQTVG